MVPAMQGTEPSPGPSPLCTYMLYAYADLLPASIWGSVDKGEEDMISQQTSLALRCHLGGLPNYQQRTWKKIFNLLTFNKSMFPKAGPCTPSALSGLQPSPHVSTLCQKGPSGGVLISYRRGKSSPVTMVGSPLSSECPGST